MPQPVRPPDLRAIAPRVRLDAGVDLGQSLTLRWTLQNEGDAAVFVFDRPTRYAKDGKLIDDPEAPYRYLRDGRLRVLVGDCPTPIRAAVTTHRVPACTRVEPGASIERVVRAEAPVAEHSVYYPLYTLKARTPEIQARSTQAQPFSVVDLLVDVLVDQPNLDARPSKLEGAFELPYAFFAWRHAARLHHATRVVETTGLRRIEIDARPTLPGEEPEAVKPWIAAGEDETP